jgi:hypothetical protein
MKIFLKHPEKCPVPRPNTLADFAETDWCRACAEAIPCWFRLTKLERRLRLASAEIPLSPEERLLRNRFPPKPRNFLSSPEYPTPPDPELSLVRRNPSSNPNEGEGPL